MKRSYSVILILFSLVISNTKSQVLASSNPLLGEVMVFAGNFALEVGQKQLVNF